VEPVHLLLKKINCDQSRVWLQNAELTNRGSMSLKDRKNKAPAFSFLRKSTVYVFSVKNTISKTGRLCNLMKIK
jgi:hypothetical protein